MQSSFEPINKFFDKIFVITLQRAAERHEHIKKELQGLNYEFYVGQDKNDHHIQQLSQINIYNIEKSINFHRYNKPMTLGHICCSWSHLKVFDNIIKNNYQKILILEDDVVVLKENISQINNILNQLPTTWELLYLGWEKHENQNLFSVFKKGLYHIQHSLGLLKWNKKQINNLYPKKYSENLSKAGFHDCTHAYAITNKAAHKLLELQTPIAFNADSLLTYATTTQLVEAYIAKPKIFNQLSQYADNRSYSFVMD